MPAGGGPHLWCFEDVSKPLSNVIHDRTEHTAERNTLKHYTKCHLLIHPHFDNQGFISIEISNYAFLEPRKWHIAILGHVDYYLDTLP
jgi:hypothetical protein